MGSFGFYLLIFLALLMAMQLWLRRCARLMEGCPAPRLDDLIDPQRLAQPRLILYVWRPGCHICGQTSSIINPLLETRPDILKINALEDLELVQRLRLTGTPALIVIAGERIEQVLIGSRNEQEIRTLLNAWPELDDDD
ncbi:MAG TPA: thioredoxin family protein [Thioalkalivibrio sp.]|nr:thioredoxin family protein [Thioalkalivibrio sp.]